MHQSLASQVTMAWCTATGLQVVKQEQQQQQVAMQQQQQVLMQQQQQLQPGLLLLMMMWLVRTARVTVMMAAALSQMLTLQHCGPSGSKRVRLYYNKNSDRCSGGGL